MRDTGEIFGMTAEEWDRAFVAGPTDDDVGVFTKDGRHLTTRDEIEAWLREIGVVTASEGAERDRTRA
jgi:hypothetical protein